MYLLKKIKTINTKGFTMSNLTRKEQCEIICKHLKHNGDDLDETVMISSVWDALKEIESKTNKISIDSKKVDVNNKNIELINDYLDLLNGRNEYNIEYILDKDNIFKVRDKKDNTTYYFKIEKDNHIFEGENPYRFNINCLNTLKEYYKFYKKFGFENNGPDKEKLANKKLIEISCFEKKWFYRRTDKIIEDYLDIIPGNYTYNLKTRFDDMFIYNITDNINNTNFSLYLDAETNHIYAEGLKDCIENIKSAYDNDIEILDKVAKFEEKYYINKVEELKEIDDNIELD